MTLFRVITFLRITFDVESVEVKLSVHKLGGMEGSREGGRGADRKGGTETEGGREGGR